jgi:hypothetical protein
MVLKLEEHKYFLWLENMEANIKLTSNKLIGSLFKQNGKVEIFQG